MLKVSRIGQSEDSSPGQSGSIACALSIPAPDLSSQLGQTLALVVRGQATGLNGGFVKEGPDWGGGRLAGGQERGTKVSWASQGSIHSWSCVIIPVIRTSGLLFPCPAGCFGHKLEAAVWELFWSKH